MKSTLAAMLATALFLMQTGCAGSKTKTVKIDPAQRKAAELIMGVTTLKGEEITFDAPGAVIKQSDAATPVTIVFGYVKQKPVSTELKDVQRLWVTRSTISTTRTVGLTAAIVVGVVVAVAAVALIAIAIKGSCPFVYSWDGQKYVFDAEPYGGAITRGLERDDYSQLRHLVARDGVYKTLLTNEVDETQYTDVMELWVADHSEGVRIGATDKGELRALGDVRTLLSATDRSGRDLVPWLKETDQKIWEPPVSEAEPRQEIVMEFSKPAGAKSANLVINAGTGLWGSFMMRAMTELRGRDMEKWFTLVDNNPAEAAKVQAWSVREELYALKIAVEEAGAWQVRGVAIGGGPFLVEDRVIPLDVSRVRGAKLRVRVQPPAGFWALNSFAVDYSGAQPVEITKVAPRRAVTPAGVSVLNELSKVDGSYCAMPNKGDSAEVRFPAPAARPGKKRTVFLHTRGWYRLHLDDKGDPDAETVSRLENIPGEPLRFAFERYGKWQLTMRK